MPLNSIAIVGPLRIPPRPHVLHGVVIYSLTNFSALMLTYKILVFPMSQHVGVRVLLSLSLIFVFILLNFLLPIFYL